MIDMMINLIDEEDREQLEIDRKKITTMDFVDKDIKHNFDRNFDELHMEFINTWTDKYGVLEDEEEFILRKTFEFLKSKI